MIDRILRHALAAVIYYRAQLAQGMTGPFVLLLGSAALGWLLSERDGWPTAVTVLVYLLETGLFLAGSTLAAVTVHRMLLLGEKAHPGWGLYWTRRESWFLLYLLGIVLVVLPTLPLAFIPLAGPWLMIPAMGYMMARCSLVFPGIAIGQGVSFRRSWEWTRNHQGQAFVLIALVPWLISFPFRFLPDHAWLMPFGVILDLALTVYIVAMLSLLYKFIVLEPMAAEQRQAASDA